MAKSIKKRPVEFEFEIALSFADEDREYVEKVASILRKMDIKVFYDRYSEVELWGKDLYSFLDEIYRKRARFTVIFISKAYAKKLWTNHERRSAQARAFSENKEYILPARFDSTQIPGILPTVGYINLKSTTPLKLAKLIKGKIGVIIRENFLPRSLDNLEKELKIRNEEDKELLYMVAEDFFESLKLMTKKEREVLALAVINACSEGIPENVHLKLQRLERLSELKREELLGMFARMDCLYFKSKIVKDRDTHEDDEIVPEFDDTMEIRYKPLVTKETKVKLLSIENATYIMLAIFRCIFKKYCPGCSLDAIKRVDLSVLSSYSSNAEIS